MSKRKYNRITDLSQEQINKIVEMYKEIKNGELIAKQFNLYSKDVLNLIRKYTPILNLGQRTRKYFPDETFFDKIDTQEKAYFLGFLYADGNNKSSRKGFSITLQERDKHILERFSNLIYGKEILKFIKNTHSSNLYIANNKVNNIQNTYLLDIGSKKMSYQLENIGCVPNKSLKLKFPDFLDKELVSHFVRGYFDGDGCLYLKDVKNNRKNGCVSIVSTLNFCNTLKEILKIIGIKSLILDPKEMIERGNNITKKMIIRGNRFVIKFLDWMYKGSVIHLNRKYEKYIELKNIINDIDLSHGTRYSNPNLISNFTDEQIDEMIRLRKSGMSYEKISKNYNISAKSIRKLLIQKIT